MVGRTMIEGGPARTAVRLPGAKALSVQDVSMGAAVRNTSFSIFDGQITGIFGLIGSGRTGPASATSYRSSR